MAVHVVPEGSGELFVVAEALAREFHDTYEAAAGDFGYATREDTKVFDPGSANGRLMVAVCAALLADGVISVPRGAGLFGSTVGAVGAVVAVEGDPRDVFPVSAVRPSFGRVVVFRSRTGAYDVPAVVTATVDSLNPEGVEAFERSRGDLAEWRTMLREVRAHAEGDGEVEFWLSENPEPALRGVPPLSASSHVHLTVLTPGLPGQRGSAADFVVPPAYGLEPMENAGGSYQEFDVPFDGSGSPGSWRWPERS